MSFLINFLNLDPSKMFQVLLAFFSVCILTKVFKSYRKRKHYVNILPGRPFRFYNPFVNIGDLLFSSVEEKIMGRHAWLLQLLMGFHQLHRRENMFCFWILHNPFVFLTKAEAVKDAISGTQMLGKAFFYSFLTPWAGGLITSKGKKWKSRRKLLTPAFHFDILKDFMPVFNEQSQILAQCLKKDTNKDFINIIEPISRCSLDIICETALGVKINAQVNSQSEYVKAVKRISELVMERISNYYVWYDFIYYFTEKGKQFKREIKILHDFTRSVVKEGKEKLHTKGNSHAFGKKRKAFMDLLLEHSMRTQSLTDEDIREEVDTFSVAGYDTTSSAVTNALYFIGLYKDVQEKIIYELDTIFGNDTDRPATLEDIKDMKYLDCVLKESLRLYPPIPIMGKEVSRDTNICGRPIPEGSTCFIVPYILHRDENVFPNPEKFDPDRFLPENCVNRHPFAYIPFSGGPRNCIGQKFALMEEKVIISTILRNFTLHSLDQRDQVILSLSLVLRPTRPLRMQIRPRPLSN